ncbi:MAG TPA: NAD(P)H-binding protein [Candidatus Dormibacteraeota bacterium]
MTGPLVAVVGAGGFVGRALVPDLLRAGYAVRRLARRPAELEPMDGVEDRRFDLDDPAPLDSALDGVDTAFYLVHAMEGGAGFAGRDRAYAHRFAAGARAAGVRHVVYLGGLHPREATLSEHLGSRREVGEILRRECDALHVRAGIILGPGSASFEIMNDLVRRLPAMVTPRWVRNRCQPIEISDVTAALVGAVEVAGDREVDLAGPDVMSYREMLERLAAELGLRRPRVLDVPVLTPGLSAHWLRFVTSVSLPVARALVQSLRHDAIADGLDLCAEVGVRPCGFDEAIRRALAGRGRVVHVSVEQQWDRRRYSLTQRFELSPAARCDLCLVERVDANLHAITPKALLHVLRWRGDELRFGPWLVVRLGPARKLDGDAATIIRAIGGGGLAAEPGGELVVACHPDLGRHIVEARLVGYAPRLPRLVYLLGQAPVHRVLVKCAVRRAIAGRPAPTADGYRPLRAVSRPLFTASTKAW